MMWTKISYLRIKRNIVSLISPFLARLRHSLFTGIQVSVNDNRYLFGTILNNMKQTIYND